MLLSPILILTVLVVGILIGSVGVGGVLLVPALAFLGGESVHAAISACMLAYLFPGAVAAMVFTRQGSMNWKLAVPLCASALPGAYLGAYLLPLFPSVALEFAIACLVLICGMHALRGSHGTPLPNPPTASSLSVFGFITGMGSSLTGTGGPVLLIPILLWRRVPVLTTIGLSQAIQIPIALTATAGNLVHGEVNLNLGLAIGVVLAGGAFIGAKAAHRVPSTLLKKTLGMVLLGVGVFILFRFYAP
ncbi:MAG: sulfite exporter TauE/SafE family protein [Gammaproteobacteria bacterium]|nr:sulfite exporter TauE/SafE family protein [Gammaproteobacteria bacterium]